MKAIIIDDEAHVREAIQLLAEWHRYGIDTIFEANDGEEAMELIMKHRPEIIFTDMMMPRKDGVALLQWIQEQGCKSKIIVVSGFDDYKFMRTAIHYGSYDYILKPIDEKILNQTLENAVNDWHLDDQERNIELKNSMEFNEVKNIYLDYLFTNLLGESSNHAYMYRKIQEEFKLNSHIECQVAIVYLNARAKENYHGNMGLCYFSLLNVFNEYLRNNNIGIAFRNLNKEDEIVLLGWKELNNFKYMIKKMYWSVFDTLKLSCIFAVGIKGEFVSNLHRLHETALNVLKKVNLSNISGKIPIFNENDLSNNKLIHPLDYSQEMDLAIYSGSENRLADTLNEIFSQLKFNKHISLEQLEIWEREYQILKNHWLDEIGIKSNDVRDERIIFWDEYGRISIEKFEEEKRRQIATLFSMYHKEKYKKEKNIIYEIKQFLEQNYQQDIKLHHISERFYLSREYISRKFKQEYNENITDYMVNIRMSKAKEFLTHSNLRICEISNLVGYQDEKYFSKVFKRYEGFTPNDYRKSRKNETLSHSPGQFPS